MKKRYFYFIAILGLLVSFWMDGFLINLVPKLRFDALSSLLVIFTFFGSWYFVLFLITLFLFMKKKEYIPKAWLAVLLSILVTLVIRILVARIRPDIALIVKDSFGFPSGHATAVFSILPFLRKNFKKFAYYWLGFSILILISRLYLGVHYFSDVVAGALVGLLVGSFVINSKLFKISKP